MAARRFHFGAARRAPGLLLGVVLGSVLGSSAAFAAVDWSRTTAFTSNGVSYENSSGISNSSSWDIQTLLVRTSHADAPVGRIGARARAYWSNGTLCERTATRYNTTATSYHSVVIRSTQCGGLVHSKGFSETWNGNGYQRVASKRTANYLY
ncbi:hypothetical protein ABFU82_10865 [Nocardioides sp. WV_118_6]|uniref:hypothetical protein n=1 Tax=Nocardioides simplex TaxID=2045 RepID=UPI00214FF7D4|nr:hypothetical protein [Pimelobacter simplex]UUW89227.1 hypothetical protein M0M43_26360 [Pimelobacter simplex]UUW93055.1 hypothetical protein M0M48_15010 [Pimelobacter simplex]